MKKLSKINLMLVGGILLAVTIVIIAVLIVSGSDSRKYQKHMEAAQQYMDELQYEQAIAEYELAIEIEPNNAKAYKKLAELYVEIEDYESAIAVLNHGIEQTDSKRLSHYLEEVKADFGKNQVQMVQGQLVQKQSEQEQMEVPQEEIQKDLQESVLGDGPREETVYMDDGSYRIDEYDENGSIVKSSSYGADEKLRFYTINERDESGNLIKTGWYNADGTLWNINEYESNGNLVFPQMPIILPSEPVKFSLPEEDSEKMVILETAMECFAVEISIFSEEEQFDANVSYYIGYFQEDGTVEMVGELGLSLYASYAFDKNCTKTFYLEKAGQYGIYIRNAVSYNPYYYSGTNVHELQMTYRVIPADKNEPNSTMEMATKLEEDEYCFFNLSGESDTDYFVINLPESYDEIEISIISETGEFDSPIVYKVAKYDETSGNMISVGSMWGAYASNAEQYNTTKTYEMNGSGNYYIEVRNASSANPLYYSGDNKSYLAIMCRGVSEENAH